MSVKVILAGHGSNSGSLASISSLDIDEQGVVSVDNQLAETDGEALDGYLKESEKGEPYGLATLDGNGQLVQMPDIADVGGSNPNLLDNWYFADPINQRNGYYIPIDTSVYTDPELTTEGFISETPLAIRLYNFPNYDGIATVVIEDDEGNTNEYYVSQSKCLKGYVPTWAYTIDRWYQTGGVVTLQEDGILLEVTPGQAIGQRLEKTYFGESTLSVLVKGTPGDALAMQIGAETPSTTVMTGEWQVCTVTATRATDNNTHLIWPGYKTGSPVLIKAAKYEIGSHQTLAHQDENGNWVLNDSPPNKALELAKCQRYQIEIFNTSSSQYLATLKATSATQAYGILPLPVTFREGVIPVLKTDCSADRPYYANGPSSVDESHQYSAASIVSLSARGCESNGIMLRATCSSDSSFLVGGNYLIFTPYTGQSSVFLDANL